MGSPASAKLRLGKRDSRPTAYFLRTLDAIVSSSSRKGGRTPFYLNVAVGDDMKSDRGSAEALPLSDD